MYESISREKFQTVLISKVGANKISKIVNLHQKKSVEWQKITLHQALLKQHITNFFCSSYTAESALKDF